MKIRVKLNADSYFVDVLKILESVPPFSRVRQADIQIYARLLHYNYQLTLQNIEEDERNKVLFEYAMRRQIQQELNINDGSYRNSLYNLKKNGIIGNKKLLAKFVIPYGEDIEFKFISI